MARRLRVLLNAFAFSPLHGSEAGVGWNFARRLALNHDVTVLFGDSAGCAPASANLTEYYSCHRPIEGLTHHFVACKSSLGQRLLKSAYLGSGFLPFWYLYYYSFYRHWQRQAFHHAEALHKQRPFDLAHQLTYITYREPGFLWKLDIPFVWGPIAGAFNVPASFLPSLSTRALFHHAFRNCANIIQTSFFSRVRRAASKAEIIFCTGREETLLFPNVLKARVEYLQATATDSNRVVATPRSYSKRRPLQICWSGFFEDGKALPLLLHAVANLPDPSKLRIRIIGCGPEKEHWENTANRLGIQQLISWEGWVNRDRARDIMNDCDVFVLTSIKEGSPTVVMEALELGLPVFAHDICGMSSIIDSTCGVKIPLKTPKVSIASFRNILFEAATNHTWLATLSKGALKRATALSWERTIHRVSTLYYEIVAQKWQN